jgi:WD40 repeat protein
MDLAVSYDNSLLATASADKLIRIWWLRNGAPVTVLRQDAIINCICFDPSSNILISAADDGRCCVWDLRDILRVMEEGAPRVDLSMRHPQTGEAVNIKCLGLSPVGGIFAVGCSDGVAHVWKYGDRPKAPASSPLATSPPELSASPSLALTLAPPAHPSEPIVFGGCTLVLEPLMRLEGHLSGLSDISFSMLGDRLLTGSMDDGTARVWSWGRAYRGLRHVVLMASQHEHASRVAGVGSAGGRVKGNTGRRGGGAGSRGPKTVLDNVVWTCDDTRIITSQSAKNLRPGIDESRQKIKVWDSFTGQLLLQWNAHMRGASSMSSNPSHPDCLVTVGADGDVCVWDALSGKGIKTFQNLLLSGPAGNEHSHGDKVGNLDVEFSPDGSSFAVADKLGRWSLYGLGSRLQEMQVGRRVPSEQYFMSDYSECIMDAQNNVLDGRTQLPTHISPRGPLINSQAIPYPLQQQPDQKKLLGPLPLSRRELSIIAAVDEWHRSRLETLLEDYEDRGFERRVAWRRLSLYHSTQEASSDAWRNARRAGTNSSLRQGSRGGSAAQRGNEEVDMAMLDHLESEAEESEVDADALSGDSEYEEAERNFARPVSTRLRTYGYRLGDGSGSDDGNAQDNGSARRRRRGRRMVSASSGDEDRHAELSSDDDSDAGSPALSSDGDEDNTDRVLADSQEHVDEEDRLPQVSRSVKPREAQPVPDQFDSAIIAIEPINGDESAAAGDADGSEVEGSAEGDPQARGANGLNPAASSQEIENVDRSTLRCAFCGFGDSEGSPLPGPGLGPHPLIAGKKRMWVHDDCAEQSPLTCVDALGNWCNVVKEVRRGAQLLCTGCRASGATIGCFIASCSHNYHFPCAVETGWEFTRSSTPFNVPVAFHCRKHRRGLNSTSAGSLVREAEANARSSLLLAQLPHESSADRSWLMKDKVTASDLYCPQVGDEVIYFPQGHKKHLEMVPLGVAAPWSRFSSKTPAALCTVTEVKYGFPGENEYSISRSVVVLIKLTVGGFFPAHAAEDRNGTDDEGGAPPLPFGEMAKMAARVDDWPAPSDGLSFHVYLRSCSQPDFLVLKQQFVDSLSQDLNPGMRIEALFQEGASNEAIAHGGVIHAINARDDEFGWSPWECLHIVWDGSDADANGGGDDLCPWEVCLLAEDGTSNWPSRPSLEKGLSNRLLSAVQEVASSQLAEFFRDPVDLYLHPNYGCYVPVPMDLGKIQRRLKNGYYRTFDAIKDDCRLIYMNCASYNKRGSAIVKTAQNLSRRLSQDLNRAKGANEDEGGEDGGCEGNDIGDSSQPSGKRGRSGREVANSDGSESDGSLEGSGAHGSPGRKQSRGNKRTCRRSQSSADEDKYHYAPVSNAGPLPWKGRPLRAGTPQGNGAARGAAIARSSRSSSRRSSRAHKLPGRFTYEDGDSDDHMDDAEREEQSKEDLARARARRLAARTQLSPAPAVVPAQTATRPRRKGAQEEEAVQASESEAEMSSGSVAKGSKTRSLASPGPGQRRRRGSYKEPKDEFDDEEVSEATPVKRTRGRWAVKRAMRGREVKDEEEEEEEEEEDSSEESDVWEKAPVRGSASRSNGRRRSKTRASRKDGHEQAGQDEEEEEVHSTQETPAKKVAGGRRHAGRAPRLKENPLKSLLCEFRQELSASKVLELVRTVSTEDWMGAPNGNLKRAGLDLLDRMNELDPFEV